MGRSYLRDDTERSLIEDTDSGDQFGLIANPPYPHGRRKHGGKRGGQPLLWLGAFAAGMLAGPALSKAFRGALADL